MDPSSPAAPALIELRDVTRTYLIGTDIRVHALRGVSLSIQSGEFVAIMGASGSGKSTLMHIIGCLDRPTTGTYHYAGRDVSAMDPDERAGLRRETFGFVFQSYQLIGTATAEENVEIPAVYAGIQPAQRHHRARVLLESLGLRERAHHRPNQLSGGQQQRVSIARALMNGGQVILADEPTGALDSTSGAELMALFQRLSDQGHTLILITHEQEIARQARRIIEIRDGRIVSDTGPDTRRAERATPPADNGLQNAAPFADALEAAKMALRALRANLFRTILTLLGIVIGVASVVAMLAIGEGAKSNVLDTIGTMGTNLLMIRPGAPNQRGSQIATLIPPDADAIAALPNVESAVPEMSGGITVRFGNTDYQSQGTATSPTFPVTRNWPVARGSFFTAADEKSYATVAVIGQTVADNVFPPQVDPLGRFILVNNVPFQVIGIMSVKGATPWGSDYDDVIFVPLTTGSLRLFGQNYLRSITVGIGDMDRIDETQDAIADLLRVRHGQEDFQIRNMASLIEAASDAGNTLTLLLGAIAAISLLVGGIGIMNIMLVSVAERTREIGIRVATGARTRNILQQFLTEAVIVSIVGGLVGIALGLASGFGVSAFDMPVKFSGFIIVLAFCCAALTGLVFGFAPALKAARLDPVVALTSE